MIDVLFPLGCVVFVAAVAGWFIADSRRRDARFERILERLEGASHLADQSAADARAARDEVARVAQALANSGDTRGAVMQDAARGTDNAQGPGDMVQREQAARTLRDIDRHAAAGVPVLGIAGATSPRHIRPIDPKRVRQV